MEIFGEQVSKTHEVSAENNTPHTATLPPGTTEYFKTLVITAELFQKQNISSNLSINTVAYTYHNEKEQRRLNPVLILKR